jgi:nitrite reductase/ring-hydroxylating ferredoxin subunit
LFEPLTGQCVRGPCIGRTLEPLRVSVSDGEIWLQPHN